MNKRGSVLVLAVVTVLIISSLSILIMGLVLTSISLQKNNEKELVAHLKLENKAYKYLNDLNLNNLKEHTTIIDGYEFELVESDTSSESDTSYVLTVKDDKYKLTVTFNYQNPLYEITGWEITKNG
jgi:5-bromo-4-chloroindolyl phosphate hydrolysis protein